MDTLKLIEQIIDNTYANLSKSLSDSCFRLDKFFNKDNDLNGVASQTF